ATGKEVHKAEAVGGFDSSLEFSPDGRLVAAGCHEEIRLWEVESGRRLPDLNKKVPRLGPYPLLAFSPDGKLLAAGAASTARAVWVWEVASGLVVHQFAGHRAAVRCLAFARDGARLVSGSGDTTALVWDLTLGVGASRPRAEDLGRQELEKFWEDLGG